MKQFFSTGRNIATICCLVIIWIPLFPGCEKNSVANENLQPDARMAIKKIALTFDDGPDSIYTPMILDILKEKHAKATFFELGNKILKHPEITKRAHDEGNLIANHTFDHIYLPGKSFGKLIRNINRTERIIDSVCGYSSKLFRPPWGAYEPAQKDSLAFYGYKLVLWDIGTPPKYDVSSIASIVIDNAAPGKIAVLHDANEGNTLDRMVIVKALPVIIDKLRAKGYTFVTAEDILSK